MNIQGPEQIPDEPPPILRTWPRVYVVVLVYLAAVIFAFYLFTVHFAP
jgi:hypothetical protein